MSKRPWLHRLALLPVFALAFAFATLWTESAHAYAWMIRHDYTACATCHADPSGGELLTRYGRVTADMILRMQYGGRKPDAPAPKPGAFWGAWDPPEPLLLGGQFRNLVVVRPDQAGDEFAYIPVMQADLQGQLRLGAFRAGGSVGLGRATPGSVHGRAAQVTTNDDGMNLLARTFYLGVDVSDSVLIRAGRLNLPFGVRIPEHTAWVRQATNTDRESDQQYGAAVSYIGEKMRAEVMAIAGNYQLGPDEFRERGYSAYVEGFAGTSVAAGISSKVTFAQRDRATYEPDMLRQAHGLMVRWAAVDTLSFLFEGDALFRTNADAGYVGFLQADYEPVTGLHLMLTGELMDQGLPVVDAPNASPGQGQPQVGGWVSVDWFFFKQFEFRMDAVFRQSEPFTLLGQLHFYL